MGVVYRAHHLAMDRAVAVKVLRGNLASDPVAARRFALEAKATTKVDSPHAVKVYDFGITALGEYFMVMEYLDGRTAQRELDVDGPMEMRRALHVARQALVGLGAAHAVGVVHRDVKPENLLLMRAGHDPDACKVLDFGVAKLMVQSADAGTALTREGMVFGTPEFMSPEQACGQPLDGRSDLYSLAATLYTLLTGEPLFRGASAVEILSKHVTTPPPRLVEQRGLESLHALDQVLQRALAKKREDRFSDAAELERALAFLAPASEAQSLSGTPTVSTHALPVQPSQLAPAPGSSLSAAESPLGLFNLAEELEAEWAAEGGGQLPGQATGAAPLLSGEFNPGRSNYLPRVTPSLELAASAPARQAPPPSPTGMAPAAPMPRPRRGRWVALLLALGAGSAIAAAALRARQPSEADATRGEPAQIAVAPSQPAQPALIQPAPIEPAHEPPPDAGATGAERPATDAPVLSEAPAADAAPRDKPADKPADKPVIDKRKLQEHLAAARAARATGNFLTQLGHADLALEISPRDPEARFLRADASLAAGDKVNGCTAMRRIKTAAAADRAAAAGCP